MKVMAKKRVENPNYQNDFQVSTTFSMFLGSSPPNKKVFSLLEIYQ
jgi:hypothetical protein